MINGEQKKVSLLHIIKGIMKGFEKKIERKENIIVDWVSSKLQSNIIIKYKKDKNIQNVME